ncbi:hypothetical protein BIW11_03011 [Tropilaelaps mercedesae]|uniref:Uncharacterized protein n=1 Tax=Tropilaelaps mercedesae TaxID=418985 RepID=A0A1V9XTI9_9ACAR|nr:hypothetical protein BIW11_03011 [Tropilaelaps mercedesae]
MSEQDLVSQIQELAREIESMDDVSSVASDSERLSPGVKPTVLWAKKRFPRQGIRSTRKIGPQRKFGFGATVRVEVGQFPIRHGQLNGHYPESWEWTQGHPDEKLPLASPLSNSQTGSQMRWLSSAASLSDESDCSIGSIAAPFEQESVSDVDETQPDPTTLEAVPLLAHASSRARYARTTIQNEKFGLPSLEEEPPNSLTASSSVAKRSTAAVGQSGRRQAYPSRKSRNEVGALKRKRKTNDVLHNGTGRNSLVAKYQHYKRHGAEELVGAKVKKAHATKRTPTGQRLSTSAYRRFASHPSPCEAVSSPSKRRPNERSRDSSARRARATKRRDGPDRTYSVNELCQKCRRPIERRERLADWGVKEWDHFWTKVSCAASDIRTLREHGLEDNDACVDFLFSFKELINIPFR